MKNFAKLMALVVVIAMSIAMLAGCAPSDYKKAEANLKDAGYATVVVENGDLVNLATAAGKTLAALYDVTLEGACTQTVTGTKDGDTVTAYYFDNSKDAAALKKAVAASVKKSKEELKKQLDDGKIKQEDYDKLIAAIDEDGFGASGKVFWMGDKEAIKAL